MNDAASRDVVLSASGLSFEVDGVRIVSDVNLEVAQGQMLGLVGPRHGGKTTLLHLCLGRLKPTAGRILVFGAPPERLGERRAWIGYAPQRPFRDYPPQTPALDFVIEGALPPGDVRRRPPDLLERAAAALEWAEIPRLADRPIGGLDAVRFWRVRLARALVNRPRFVILDDLGAGLMAHERLSLLKRVARMKEELDLTALLITRDIAPVQDIVSELVCLNTTVQYRGSPSFISRDALMRMYTR